jgi:hypothetical protein
MGESTDRFSNEQPGCVWRSIVLGMGFISFLTWIAYTLLSEMGVLDSIRLAWKFAGSRPTAVFEVAMALIVGLAFLVVWFDAREWRRIIQKESQKSEEKNREQL